MMRRLAIPLALLVAACTPKRIPGTEVRDTEENRAVYAVVEAYVRAMNQRDAAGVLAQVSPDYFDDAGTAEPGDDLDRERLGKALAADLARLETVKLAVSFRKIEVQGDAAFAEIFYDSYYRVQTPAGPIPRRDSDVNRIRLKKIAGEWKITSGL